MYSGLKKIEEIIEYTDCHYAEHITLEQLCRDYYCSVSNISILFKSQTGITFSEYLKETRIKKSCKLLTNSDKSIEEINSLIPILTCSELEKVRNEIEARL